MKDRAVKVRTELEISHRRSCRNIGKASAMSSPDSDAMGAWETLTLGKPAAMAFQWGTVRFGGRKLEGTLPRPAIAHQGVIQQH